MMNKAMVILSGVFLLSAFVIGAIQISHNEGEIQAPLKHEKTVVPNHEIS